MTDWITDYINVLEGLNKGNLESLKAVSCPEFDFKDPFSHTHHLDDFIALLNHMYSKLDKVVFKVDQVMVDGNDALIHWQYSATSRFTGDILFTGTSKIKADETGKVYFHHDYWDGSELLAKVPLAGSVVRFLRGKFAYQPGS